ncbi:MAG: ABC transporter permease [Zavarzinella sp.]
MEPKRYSAIWELTRARIREFFREPAAVFWVYCFPLLIALALGIAFRERPVERITVDIDPTGLSEAKIAETTQLLQQDSRLVVRTATADWQKQLAAGKTDLIIAPKDTGYLFWDEVNRPESVLARHAVEAILLRQANASGPPIETKHLEQPGSRYIDFLLPGLLGMNLMGGGLWGIGFVIADMRVRKLLKRFLATPMVRRDFLLSIMFSRLIFTIPEVLVLLLFGYLLFDVRNQGTLLELITVICLGGFCFGGLGLLVASRVKTIESVSGLMNAVMLPMYVVSGVFFSSERFPEIVQPLIKVLPLTALIDSLRGVMLEGKHLTQLMQEIIIMLAWGGIGFVIALRIFRWK